MRFWDSSAIVPLLVAEPSTSIVAGLIRDDPEVLVWWATPVEAVAALARLERDGILDSAGLSDALARLEALELGWHEVQPTPRVRSQASRLLRVHPLRAADALQLAAGVVAAEGDPATLAFVTLDERLALAADREGLRVVP